MNDSIRFLSGGIDRAGRAVADEGVEIQAAAFSDGVPVHPALQVWIVEAPSEEDQTGLDVKVLGGETVRIKLGKRTAHRKDVSVRVIQVLGAQKLVRID